MEKIVIGLVGPIASGKGTVIKYLTKKGFLSSSTSDRIREEILLRGQKITRFTLTEVSNDLRQYYGNAILAKKTAEIVDKSGSDKIVIDSIRNPEEINYLKERYNMKVIAVVADQKKRYELFIKRVENSQPMTFEEFKQLDDKELSGIVGKHSQRVSDCIKMADFVIDNNGTLKNLEEKIEKLLSEFLPSNKYN